MKHQKPLVLLVGEILQITAIRLPESGKKKNPPPPLLQNKKLQQVKRGQVIKLVPHGQEEIRRIERQFNLGRARTCHGELLACTGRT